MQNRRSNWRKVITTLISLILVLGGIIFNNHLQSLDLYAATTTEGVKIIDFYPTANMDYHNAYAVSDKGEVYYIDDASNSNSYFQKVKDSSGKPLKNIKRVFASFHQYSADSQVIFFLDTNNKLYVKGSCATGTCGIGVDDASYQPYPVPVNSPELQGTIKDISSDGYITYIIMEDGNVYAAGIANDISGYGYPTGDPNYTERSYTFIKTAFTNIKQISSFAFGHYSLDYDNHVKGWAAGSYARGFKASALPTKLLLSDSETYEGKVSTIPMGYGTSYQYGDGIIFAGEDGKLYTSSLYGGDTDSIILTYASKMYSDTGPSSYYVVAEADKFNFDFNGIDYLCAGMKSLSFVKNGTFYMAIADPVSTFNNAGLPYRDPLSNQNSSIQPYVKGQINGSTRVIKAMGQFADTWVLRDDNKLFYRGEPVRFAADIAIEGKKPDNSEYNSAEKYKNDVTLLFNRGDGFASDAMYYKKRDLPTGTFGAETLVPDSEEIIVSSISGSRVYQEYKVYYAGKEDLNYATFIVDIYKHDFVDVSVQNNNYYAQEDELTWDVTNGLVGNNVAATLLKPRQSTAIDIAYGYVLNEVGTYTLNLVDDYGNTFAASFQVLSVPRPISMKFSPSGELRYKNEHVIQNARVGDLELQYAPEEIASTISTIEIVEGNEAGYFSVVKDSGTSKYYIEALADIPIGTYTLKFSGTDGNNTSFRKFPITIKVEKANNPMKWNSTSQSAADSGIYLHEPLQVGVVDKPDEMGVTYSLKEAVEGVSIDSSNGTVTIGDITSDSIEFIVVATPSNTNNYELTPIELTITARKQTIYLKTIMIVDGTEKDHEVLELGTPLPNNMKVVAKSSLPSGVTITQPDSFKIYDVSDNEVTSIVQAGVYTVKPVYSTSPYQNYKVEWTYGDITANPISIDDSNASDFYELTIDDGSNTPYVPGTWTNHSVKIKPKHASYNKMKVDAGDFLTTTQSYQREGINTITLTFEGENGIQTSTTIPDVKIDKTAPILNPVIYENESTSVLANILRVITFDQLFSQAQTATFSGTDTNGSGIAKYHYVVSKIDETGDVLSTYAEGDGTSVSLEKNNNYKLTVYAIDVAGNTSLSTTETIQINDIAPEITIDANIQGTSTVYNGTLWTSKPIEVVLSSDQTIESYAWSKDGTTFEPLPSNTFTIPNTENINSQTYTFRGTSPTQIDGFKTLLVKIDKDVPDFTLQAVSKDLIYDGTKTDQNVTINLSQTSPNISGVTYYYCNDLGVANTNPLDNLSAWKRVNGNQVLFDQDQANVTYYFKAVSNAGLASAAPKEQVVFIEKKIQNPSDMNWTTPEDETITYGNSTFLTIENTNGKEVVYTVTGGGSCLEFNEDSQQVTAINGTCPPGKEMEITAQVGNYETPLYKRITAKKADLHLQTVFLVNGAKNKTTSILKGGNIPTIQSDFVNGKGLIQSDSALVGSANDLGNFVKQYIQGEGSPSSSLDTSMLGTYKVRNVLNSNSVTTITGFGDKYNVTTLDAILQIADDNIPDEELYEIEGPSENDSGWYTDKVKITPLHSSFTKMGIDSSTPITGEQTYPSGDIVNGSHDIDLLFEDNLSNQIHKYPTIKIDNLKPDLTVLAKSNGSMYNGAKSERSVTITLSQTTQNVSGVTYYYCTNESIANSDPSNSGWTKMSGSILTLDTNQNTTYYFKAMSGAGLSTDTAVSQKVWIEMKDPNPIDMKWSDSIVDDLAYGETTTLAIDNTQGKSITYTSTGGEDCISFDPISGDVVAISGVCSTDMEISAQVGNYAMPLTKTIKTHKAKLEFQTVFDIKGISQIATSIYKGGSLPSIKVEFSNQTRLVGEEASIQDPKDIGDFKVSYTKDGTTSTSIDTSMIGEYQVQKKLDSNTILIADFNMKYTVLSQNPAVLNINDTQIDDTDLFTISGNHSNDEWYTGAVQIKPIHSTFNKMSIDGGASSTQAQTYPSSADVDGKHLVNLKFEDNSGSSLLKSSIPIHIDSQIPMISIEATSNGSSYTSGADTMYNINVKFVSANTNISGVTYFITSDVDASGNVKPNANWQESGNFQIIKKATYYMKAVSGAGLESTPVKFFANINKPDTTKLPTIKVISNDADFVANENTWARNDVTFMLSGNHAGYEVCTSAIKNRTTDCDDRSSNWTSINDDGNQMHRITNDQNLTYYWFRNQIPGFTTRATDGYPIKIDSVQPEAPEITVTENQNLLMSLFSNDTSSYHNKPVSVVMQADDDRSGIASLLYDIYDANGNVIKENQSYTDVLTYKDANIQLRAKAIDKAGNQSVVSDNIVVSVDTIAPSITGVKNGVSYYIPYVFIAYQDNGSGIDASNTTYTNNDTTEELGNNTLFNGKGKVSINVQDKAGNSSALSFEILGLPERTDCSTESLALIDSIKAQYNDVKGHLNDTQKKEITDWLAKYSNSCSISDPDHDVTVENPEAKIPENTVLVVDVITTTIDDVNLSLGKDEEVKMAYDVYFKKGETVFKDLEGSEMKVKLPLGAFKEAKGLRLVSVEEDGTSKDIVYEREGDYAVFTTSTLKKYAFIAEKSKDPNINVDFDCDGDADINIDTDSDGIPNINIDTTGDGKANYNVDLDGDGIPDLNIGPVDWKPDLCKKTDCGVAYCTSTYYKPYLNIDSDADGRPDINVDLDKDMEADINIDTDFDNIPNVDIDSDGDGKADINIDDNGDGKADRNLLDLKEWKPNLNLEDPIKFDTMANLKPDSKPNDKDDPNDPSDPNDPNEPDKPSIPGNGDDSNNSSSDNSSNNDKVVTVEPSVKGSYTDSSIGGALTGLQDTLPWCISLLVVSGIIVTITIRRRHS